MRRLVPAVLGVVLVVGLSAPPASAAMNRAEKHSQRLVNAERADHGQGALKAQRCLQRHAQAHARQLAKANRLHHQSTSTLRAVMRRCELSSIGENIAHGKGMTAPQVVRAWMRSPGHRANILKPEFNRIGAAHQTGTNGQRYWIQLYGRH